MDIITPTTIADLDQDQGIEVPDWLEDDLAAIYEHLAAEEAATETVA